MRHMDAVEASEANTHYIEYTFGQAQDANRIFINKASLLFFSLSLPLLGLLRARGS